MSIQIVQQWIQELGQRIGNSGLAMTNGTCTLKNAKTHIAIEYAEAANEVHIWSPVGTLPTGMDQLEYADLYDALLAENLTGTSTGNARFALDAQRNRILLCESLPVTQDNGTQFHELVPLMLEISEQWHARFNDTET